MTGLADVDAFKIYIQLCMWLGLLPLFIHALTDFLIVLQWKCSHLLDTKQPKFTESSTPKRIFERLNHTW